MPSPKTRKPTPDVALLVKAAQVARGHLHVELMRDPAAVEDDMDRVNLEMGQELAAEASVLLAEALMPFAPDVLACRGCAERSVWASSPRALLEDRAERRAVSAGVAALDEGGEA